MDDSVKAVFKPGQLTPLGPQATRDWVKVNLEEIIEEDIGEDDDMSPLEATSSLNELATHYNEDIAKPKGYDLDYNALYSVLNARYNELLAIRGERDEEDDSPGL